MTSLVSHLFELQCISRKGRKDKEGRLYNAMSHPSDVLTVSRILCHGMKIETAQLLKSLPITIERACLPFTAFMKISHILGSAA